MARSRFLWVDYAKGIAILLVLYRHIFEGIKAAGFSIEKYMGIEYANIAFYSFRMPLFFIISGIFFSRSLGKRGLAKFIESKARTILYVYVLWASFQIIFQLLLANYVNADRSLKDFLYILYFPRNLDQFWYLHTLFLVIILYAIVSVKLKLTPIWQVTTGLVLYFISCYVFQADWQLYFINDILHYYLFFGIGDLLSRYFFDENSSRKLSSWKVFFVLLPFFVLGQYYFVVRNVEKFDINKYYQYVEYYEPLLYLLIALVGCLFVIVVCFKLQSKEFKWLKTVGSHSLYIYVSHVFAASATRILLSRVLGIDNVPVLLIVCMFSACVFPILLYKFSQKMGWYWLFSLEKPAATKKVLNPATVAERPGTNVL